jgi:hypothetical protein
MVKRDMLCNAAGIVLSVLLAGSSGASVLVPQTALPGQCLNCRYQYSGRLDQFPVSMHRSIRTSRLP